MNALKDRPFPTPMHEDREARRWEPPDPCFDGFFQHRVPAIRYLHVYAKKRPEMMAAAQRKSDIPARSFPFVGTGAISYAVFCLKKKKALNLTMDRTVRLALWSREEQGLYGSRGYLKE